MATYLLFSGFQYYPAGGADDDALDQAAEQEGIVEWWKLTRLDDRQLTPIFEGYDDGAGRTAPSTSRPVEPVEPKARSASPPPQ